MYFFFLGVYPYKYTDSWDRLEEQQLPQRDEIYSTLTEDGITEDNYNHAQNVWEYFKFKTSGEYNNLYLKIDVLFTDDFENFRDIYLKTYSLDPSFNFTCPGLSFHAMLKYTAVELEHVSDYDMLLIKRRLLL